MDWLSQNWGWFVLLVGGYLLMSRMGVGGCGMGMGHSHGHNHASGHGGGIDDAPGHAVEPVDLLDPASRHTLAAATGFASVHQGQIYHFEDRASRDAFEAGVQTAGQHAGVESQSSRHVHQGHGCC